MMQVQRGGGQTYGQERSGQPAVTSPTTAETIHLAGRGPPKQPGPECAHASVCV